MDRLHNLPASPWLPVPLAPQLRFLAGPGACRGIPAGGHEQHLPLPERQQHHPHFRFRCPPDRERHGQHHL